mgnify:FL=1
MSDLGSLAESFEEESGGADPFSVILHDERSVQQLTELTLQSVSRLVGVVGKLQQPRSSEELISRNSQLVEKHVELSSQVHELEAKLMVAENKLAKTQGELTKACQECEDLVAEKEKLGIRLVQAGEAVNCVCSCYCGARSELTPSNGIETAEVAEILKEKEALKTQLEEEVRKNQKLLLEFNVSEERFLKTKAFRQLVSEARSVSRKYEEAKKSIFELKSYRDKYEDRNFKEVRRVLREEEEKKNQLQERIKQLQEQLACAQSERDTAQTKFNLLTEQSNISNNFSSLEELVKDLRDEKSSLRTQLEETKQKLSEMKSKLDAEHNKSTEALENKNGETEPDKARLISQLQSSIKSLKEELETERLTNDSLISELEITNKAYEEMSAKREQLAKQLAQQEQTYNQVVQERLKETSVQSLHNQEIQAYEEKLSTKDQLIEELKILNLKTESQLTEKQNLVESLESNYQDLQTRVEKFIIDNYEEIKKALEVKNLRESYQEGLETAQKQAEETGKELSDTKLQVQLSGKKIEELEGKLRKAHDVENLKSTDERLNNEVARYRKMVRCFLCSDRIKDVVIAKCFHAFCRQCIEENLAKRQRKCPTCQTKFGADDVKTFWWR